LLHTRERVPSGPRIPLLGLGLLRLSLARSLRLFLGALARDRCFLFPSLSGPSLLERTGRVGFLLGDRAGSLTLGFFFRE
jgi:hypothetical protein